MIDKVLQYIVIISAIKDICLAIGIEDDIDWKLFMSRHDPIWTVSHSENMGKSPFTAWYDGPFFGNGLVGGLFRFDSTNINVLRMDLGRSDVWDQRRPGTPGWIDNSGLLYMRPRLPIGHLEITLPKAVCSYWVANFRTRLYTAEIEVSFTFLDGSNINFTAFAPAQEPSGIVLHFESTVNDFGTDSIKFVAEESTTTRHHPPRGYKANPPAVISTQGEITVSTQQLLSGGNYAVALRNISIPRSNDVKDFSLYLTIAMDAPKNTSIQTSVKNIKRIAVRGWKRLYHDHCKWWSDYYPRSFVSLAQTPLKNGSDHGSTMLESFYWIQMYKFASAVRSDGLGPAMDLMGPWFQPSSWLYYWFDLNEQLQYWPVYTANRLPLGQSLVDFITHNITQLQLNAQPKRNPDTINDTLAIGGSCPADMECGANFPGMVGDGPWICHNLWMQARYSGNTSLLVDTVYPILKGMINMYVNNAFSDNQGKIHLPHSQSPEYPHQNPDGIDANFDIALFQWGLQTLIETANSFVPKEPLLLVWKNLLGKLTTGPIDNFGYMVDNKTPFNVSHRHFSHAFHIYPLHLVQWSNKGHRHLMEETLDHWFGITCRQGGKCPNGYTYTGTASMSALMGRYEAAVGNLTHFLTSGQVHPSTMYAEGQNPVIESPLAAAATMMELLLTSWGGLNHSVIRVFPALPPSWPDAVFHKFLAEGGFEISAVRKNGTTQFVQVSSLSGSTRCVLSIPSMQSPYTLIPHVPISILSDGSLSISLKKNETVLIFSEGTHPELKIKALVGDQSKYNYWGEH